MPQEYVIEQLYQIGSRLIAYGNYFENKMELSLPQLFLLYKMLEWSDETDGKLSVSSLSQKTGLSKSSVCSTVQALKRLGYLTKNISNVDNRRKEIVLTEKANAVSDQITEQIQRLDQQLCCGVPPHELQTIRRALWQIAENMHLQPVRAP